MAREFSRTDRVGAQIQRELAQLVSNELHDDKLGMVTIQEVRVVRDFSHAKVFFTVIGDEEKGKQSTEILNKAAPFLRHELGRRMKIRSLPQLHFVYDESVAEGMRLTELIDRTVALDNKKHQKPDNEDE